MYILDTDTCVFWLKGNHYTEKKIEEQGIENIFVTIITACELYFGAYNSQKKDNNMLVLDDLFSMIGIIQTTSEVAKIFGETKTRLKRLGKLINDADLLIASIVVANNGVLVTNNTAHFERVPDLNLENWLL